MSELTGMYKITDGRKLLSPPLLGRVWVDCMDAGGRATHGAVAERRS